MDFNHVPNPTRLWAKTIETVVIIQNYLDLLVSENYSLLPIKTDINYVAHSQQELTIMFWEYKHNLLKLWVIDQRIDGNLTVDSKLLDFKFLYDLVNSKIP